MNVEAIGAEPVVPDQAAIDCIARWREDPVTMVRELFGVEPDPWQAVVLRKFPTKQRQAMKACKGPGKTALLAWCCWNFLLTRPHPKIVATSITGDNLRDNLWVEMSKWQQKSPLLAASFTWAAERITSNDHPETWWMSARTWSKGADSSQQANTLAGIHADYVLFVLDESGGIPDAVMAAAEGGLSTGVECKIVQAGNPTHLSGPLYRACTRERHLWDVTEITGDPDDPMRSSRISVQWAREQIQKYGKDNPWVLVNVFGKFPPGQSNALLGIDDCTAAAGRTVTQASYYDEVKILGVDVARFGDDRSVLQPRQGKVAFVPKVFRNLDTMQLAGQVATFIRAWDPDAVFIDQTGIGAGVVDRLRQLGFPVIGIDNGQGAIDAEQFLNRRAEMWWKLAEWVKAGGCIPDDAELLGELVAPTYKFTPDNRLQLESKADLKKRGLPSPDKADALSLTFAQPVAHRGIRGQLERIRMGAGPRVAHEYNPMEG